MPSVVVVVVVVSADVDAVLMLVTLAGTPAVLFPKLAEFEGAAEFEAEVALEAVAEFETVFEDGLAMKSSILNKNRSRK